VPHTQGAIRAPQGRPSSICTWVEEQEFYLASAELALRWSCTEKPGLPHPRVVQYDQISCLDPIGKARDPVVTHPFLLDDAKAPPVALFRRPGGDEFLGQMIVEEVGA